LFYERDFSKSLDASVVQVDGEMDWVNSHFRNSMDVLDGFYALLVGEWCGDDKIFQYWQKYFQKGPEWILAHAPIVHFIAEWKPWRLTTPEQLQR
ncbi:SLC1A2, partial [Symbiodinium pilosum]